MRAVLSLAAAALFAVVPAAPAQPLSTAFTFQGELRLSGVPATGTYDLQFKLYDAATLGAQIGSTICADNIVFSNGRFTQSLDFGAAYAGQKRFLEVSVRADAGSATPCSTTSGFTTLAPRQELTATPNAVYALNASTANTASTATNSTQLNGQSAAFYQNASNLNAGSLPAGLLGGTYANALTLSNASNAFTGSGAGLTSLNAANISSGTLADARLSSNIPRLNAIQTFSAQNTFSSRPFFTDAAGPFIVTSTTLVSNLNAQFLNGHADGYFIDATNLTLGTLSDARLSTNVGLLSGTQTFSGAKTFSVAPSFTAALVPFSVTGTGVVTNLNADMVDGFSAGAFGQLAGTQAWSGANTFSNASNSFTGSFTGTGSGLTSLNATNITSGTLADARLSANVALLGSPQTFSATKTFSAAPSFTAVGAPFAVTATGVVTNLNADLLDGQSGAFYQNASNTNAGTLADARLSSNIPKLNTSNIFTAPANRFSEVNVDSAETNDGTFSGGLLRLGGSASGEGIASNRTSDVNGNRYGIDFYTNLGQKRMSITLDGKVGVGSQAPGMSLQVAGPPSYYGKPTLGVAEGSSFLYLLADNNYHPGVFWTESQGLRFGTETAPGTGYAERMRITGAGRVGIGTPDPLGLFQVGQESVGPSQNIVIPGPATAGLPYSSTSDLPRQTFFAATDADIESIDVVVSNSSASTQLSYVSIAGPGINVVSQAWNLLSNPTGQVATYAFSPAVHIAAGQTYTWSWIAQVPNGTARAWYRTDNPYPSGQGAGPGLPPNSDFVCTIRSTVAPQITPIGLVVTDFRYTGIRTQSPTQPLTVNGNALFTGTISKGGGSFQIDHPLDPENKYLFHSFVESPDMKNIYDGVATTDDSGYATIQLPDWFEALNRDFRYQLTIVDEADSPELLLWAKVVHKIHDNRFTIRTSRPRLEVSWQVTGIREDAFANANRIPLEVDKAGRERGRYLHPEAFGQSPAKGIFEPRSEARP